MRVLIVEQNHLGHYYNNDRFVIDAVRSLGAEVVLAVTPEGLASEEFDVHLKPHLAGVDVRPILRSGRAGMINGIVDAAHNLNLAARNARPDVLYVVTADGIAQASGLAKMVGLLKIPRNVHCECLINRLTFTYPASIARAAQGKRFPLRPAARHLSLLALRKSPFARIHVIDALAHEWMMRHGGVVAKRVTMIPDPVEDFTPMSRDAARDVLGLERAGRYLICPGLLDERKGIRELIAAFDAARLAGNDRLVLAGRVTPQLTPVLAAPIAARLIKAGRLRVLDRVLSKHEFAASLSAADVVACTYPYQPHPASIGLKALACSRPILAADSAWLGCMVPKFDMGWTVDVSDPFAFATIIPRCFDESAKWQPSEHGRRLIRFSSAENYQRHWTAGLRNLMGLPADRADISWDSLI